MAIKKKPLKPRIAARQYLEDLTGGPLTFGRMIESTRLAEGESLDAFSRRLGVSRSYLCDVEKGRRTVSVQRAAQWACKLGYLEAHYVALALQAEVTAAGLDLKVTVAAA